VGHSKKKGREDDLKITSARLSRSREQENNAEKQNGVHFFVHQPLAWSPCRRVMGNIGAIGNKNSSADLDAWGVVPISNTIVAAGWRNLGPSICSNTGDARAAPAAGGGYICLGISGRAPLPFRKCGLRRVADPRGSVETLHNNAVELTTTTP
jgi:hypothetical protein